MALVLGCLGDPHQSIEAATESLFERGTTGARGRCSRAVDRRLHAAHRALVVVAARFSRVARMANTAFSGPPEAPSWPRLIAENFIYIPPTCADAPWPRWSCSTASCSFITARNARGAATMPASAALLVRPSGSRSAAEEAAVIGIDGLESRASARIARHARRVRIRRPP